MTTTQKPKTAKTAAGARTLHLTNPPLKGPDVKELQKLLQPYNPGKADGEFGPATADAVRRAKRALGYPPDKCDGSAGELLVGYLKGEPLPKEFKTQQAAVKKEAGSEQALRKAIVAFAEWGMANEAQIHYEQLRPMDGVGHARKLPLKTDCSGFSTLCYAWAGAPDPNGSDYNGQGYTGTMLRHMQRIPASAAEPGDLVVWGEFPGHHVALVIKAGADPVVCSHGQEKGPFPISVSQETTYQKTPAIYLTLPSWT